MMIVSKDNKVVTLINVFTVEPEKQQTLVGMLVEATDKTMKHYLPGFVSATIHKSADGVRVANYAQCVAARILRRCLKTLKQPRT
jgi:hypothetical protein